ncbi:YadA-like family protein [Histophilus somni]|uniref:YadA-like family protein n=1 Tax=Histophilus somni TaxID=731 RepID=UPI001B34F00F|nr:YadA-like family protein [Histophilus somni]
MADGEISATSDQAITGAQLNSAKEALGLEYQKDSQTKFKKHDFTAVNYVEAGDKGSQDTFKAALTETIAAINSGYKFSDGTPDHPNKDTPFYLGSTIEIKAGDISSNNKKTYSGTNLKTKFKPKDGDNTVAEFTIGLSDTPSFTSVTVTGIVDDNSDGKTLTTKTYVDGKLANVAANFTVKGDDGGVGYTLNKDNTELNIKGKQAPNTHQNIKTSVNSGSKAVNIELNSELKGVKSITGKDIPNGANSTVNSKIEFNRQNGSKATTNVTISSNGANYTFDRTGLDVNDRRITRLQSGFNRSHKGQQNSVETATLSTILDGTYDKDNQKTKIENNAVNVGDLSKVAQEILKKELTFQGNGGETDKVTRKLGETLKIVGKGDQANNVTVANNNIKVSKNTSSDGLEIGLSDALTGIKSIANGDNAKIALENDKKAITFTAGDQTNTKDVTLSAGKFSGVSQVGVDDNNALVFKNGDSKKTAELKVGGASLTFTPTGTNQTVKISNLADGQITDTSTDAITGKQLNDLAGKLGVTVNNTTGFTQPSFTAINYKDSKKTQQSTFKGAIEDLITAVNKGIVFKGNEDKAQPITMQLGGSLTIDSSSAGNEKDITAKVATDGVDGSAKITLGLNKANTVAEDDEKVVTSKAVATILKQYTKTSDIGNTYLKIDGTNIGGDSGKKTFGQNVGLAAINLTTDKESTQLVQAKALIAYLKGAGEKSVKISDNLETKAEGEGSISIGDKAVSKNEGSIALGYGANALNTASISIGQNSIVTGLKAVSLGSNNTVGGDSSIVLGETNTVAGVQSFVMGTNNNISGRENIVFGSRNTVSANSNIVFGSDITIDDTNITDAIVLGNGSTAEKTALSIGNEKIKRRIANVAEPTKEYDAANKKYVDARGLKFKGNDGQEQRVNLDKLLTIDSSESKTKDGNTQEKDIKTSVTKEGDEAKLTLTLNKADKVSEHDERAVTSKAVHAAIGEVKNSLANAEISYKANGKGDKTVKLTDGFDFTDGSNTTAEVGEKGVVKFNLNKELKDMTSFETEAKDGNKAKLDQSGLTVGNKDATNGDATNGDKTHTVYGKDGLTVHSKDGKSAVSLKVADGKDGKAQSATLEFSKGDDDKGTGSIKGLKDLDKNSTGDMAANKNYVDEKFGEVDKKLDEKIASANSNRPFDYYAGEEKVVKGQDGQFYKPDEIKDAKFEGGKYKKDGQEVKITVKQDDVVIKAEPKTGPMKITNVKDGDLTDKSTDAVNGSQLVKATGAKFIDDPNSTEPKAKKMVFADGKDGKSGLEANSMAMKGLTDKDGLNGKNANDKANALRNGEAGTVVFTDDKGERLVKANDGKYYKATDVENNGMPKGGKSAVDNPQLSLVNTGGETDKPVVLGNVASGLDIDDVKSKEAADKTNNANKVVRDKAKDLSDKVSDMLKKGEELDTLRFSKEAQQDAVDALETALKYMPEETDAEKEAKSRVKDNLKREKQKLSELMDKFTEAEKRVKEAKEAVEKAKDTLKTSKSSYENALKESNREINALLSGDKKINVHHRGANLQDLQALGQAGLNFEGNDGVPVHKNLGEKLTIKGEDEFNSVTTAAGNIKVDASETGLEVKLSDTLKNMTSFETKETVEGNKSRLDGNGLRVTHKDGKSAQYGVDGVRLTDGKHSATLTPSGLTLTNPQGQRIEIDGAKGEIRVPDLTPNSSPNAVVNKGYVDALQTHTDKKFNQLENRFDAFSKESRAGIAGSNAAAALPTISIPGKSVLSVSAGTYKGQSAVALGYSRVSDNGKVLLKLHGNSNSVGDFGGGVGIGWAW